jgi:hypothetical protein
MNRERFDQGTNQLYGRLTEGKAKLDAFVKEMRHPPVQRTVTLELTDGEIKKLRTILGEPTMRDCECDLCHIRRKVIASLAERQSTQVSA